MKKDEAERSSNKKSVISHEYTLSDTNSNEEVDSKQTVQSQACQHTYTIKIIESIEEGEEASGEGQLKINIHNVPSTLSNKNATNTSEVFNECENEERSKMKKSKTPITTVKVTTSEVVLEDENLKSVPQKEKSSELIRKEKKQTEIPKAEQTRDEALRDLSRQTEPPKDAQTAIAALQNLNITRIEASAHLPVSSTSQQQRADIPNKIPSTQSDLKSRFNVDVPASLKQSDNSRHSISGPRRNELLKALSDITQKGDPKVFNEIIKPLNENHIRDIISVISSIPGDEQRSIVENILPSILTDDAHLIAMYNGDIQLVEYLLDLLKDKENKVVENSRLYPVPVTPLTAASLTGNSKMVKMLLSRGHTLKPVNNTVNNKTDPGAQLHQFYELDALMSPAYIDATQSNPFTTCLKYTKIIRLITRNIDEPLKSQYEKIIERMQDYCITLLRNVQNNAELEIILSQKVYESNYSVKHPVLQEMIEQKWTRLLREPLIQELRNQIWVGNYYISVEQKQSISYVTALLRVISRVLLEIMIFCVSASPQQSYLISVFTETLFCICLILHSLNIFNSNEIKYMITVWAVCYTVMVGTKIKFRAFAHKMTALENIILIQVYLFCLQEMLIAFAKRTTVQQTNDAFTLNITIANTHITFTSNNLQMSRDFLIVFITTTIYVKLISETLQATTRAVHLSLYTVHILLIAFFTVSVLFPLISIMLQLSKVNHCIQCFTYPRIHMNAMLILATNLLVATIFEAILSPEIIEDEQRNFEWTAKVITTYHMSKTSFPIPFYAFQAVNILFIFSRNNDEYSEKHGCNDLIRLLKERTHVQNIEFK